MCVYCEQDKYGSKKPFGLFRATMKPNADNVLIDEVEACSAFIYIHDEIDDVVIVSLGFCDIDVSLHEMKINYCPICGRKLNKINGLKGNDR